ncbi:MAG: sugar kinase [Caulobacteraceae bacterium]
MTRVVAIGECMVELVGRADGAMTRAFAGDAYNAAVQLKRSAPKVEVQFATVTGTDPLSLDMRQSWRGEGIDETLSPSIAGLLPGLYMVETDAAGERRFSYWRGQSAARRWLGELDAAALDGADMLFMTGVSLAILPPDDRPRAIELAGRARAFAFDPNIRPALWESGHAMRTVVEAAIARATILLPSVDDLASLWGDTDPAMLIDRCQGLGGREVALTDGARGCWLGDAPALVPAPHTIVVDTSGAGDAFNGAYLAARLQGSLPADAARAALALAARVVSLPGALPPGAMT